MKHENLDDLVLVDEDSVARSMVGGIEHAHTLAESASGAALAAQRGVECYIVEETA